MPYIQFQFRRDTSTNWWNNNPVLANGEMGIETDTNQFKIGDANGTAWRGLSYGGISGPPGNSSVQIVATSGSSINLEPTMRGNVLILTGTTTQSFTTTNFGAGDTNFYVVLRNGNAPGASPSNITISGATGNLTLYGGATTNSTAGQSLYLTWNGTALVSY